MSNPKSNWIKPLPQELAAGATSSSQIPSAAHKHHNPMPPPLGQATQPCPSLHAPLHAASRQIQYTSTRLFRCQERKMCWRKSKHKTSIVTPLQGSHAVGSHQGCPRALRNRSLSAALRGRRLSRLPHATNEASPQAAQLPLPVRNCQRPLCPGQRSPSGAAGKPQALCRPRSGAAVPRPAPRTQALLWPRQSAWRSAQALLCRRQRPD